MKIFAKSDIGKSREMNQDSYFISTTNDDVKLFILADGMGGYEGGEVASKLAIECSKSYILNNFNQIPKEKDEIMNLIRNAIEYANLRVYEESQEHERLSEMGTTIDVSLIYNGKVYVGHVGDSRVYRIRNDIIRKITTDHSYVEKLIKEGSITKEEAYHHPKRNMLMKALGCNSLVEPDLFCKGFLKDDILLMCSDGLTNMIKEDEIFNIIVNNLNNPADKLIEQANDNGGYDNVTAIVLVNN